MVLSLTILLILSTLGMLAILGLKRYELTTGRVFLAGVRPGLRAFFRQGLFWFERVLPNLIAHEGRRGWLFARAQARAAAAWVLLLVESVLERGLIALRRATAHGPRTGREASPFLREVVEHKKKLQEGLSEEE